MGGVVLVHGLYHQAGHFGVVAAGLRRVGVEVVVPELHRGSLREDTRVVQEVVDGFGVAPVVVGHSYGGSVITGVRGAGHLVYLAAFVLDAGESAAGWGGGSAALREAVVAAGEEGATRLRPELAAGVLYDDCPAPLARRAVELLREQGPGCGRGVPERQGWRTTPSTYVVCAGPGGRPRGAAAHGRAVRGGAGVADRAFPVRRAAGAGRGAGAGGACGARGAGVGGSACAPGPLLAAAGGARRSPLPPPPTRSSAPTATGVGPRGTTGLARCRRGRTEAAPASTARSARVPDVRLATHRVGRHALRPSAPWCLGRGPGLPAPTLASLRVQACPWQNTASAGQTTTTRGPARPSPGPPAPTVTSLHGRRVRLATQEAPLPRSRPGSAVPRPAPTAAPAPAPPPSGAPGSPGRGLRR
ncbi:alpha/beta fold hydrolase [Streptomyces albidoflavus]